MTNNIRLLPTLISTYLALSVFLTGCQTNTKTPNENETLAQSNNENSKKERAILLARVQEIPAQIAIAGLGRNPTGLNSLKSTNANCDTWKNQLSGLLSTNTKQQEINKNQELKIGLSAVQLITSGQFLMDIPALVTGVSSNVAAFPLDLYRDIDKLKIDRREDKIVIQDLKQKLLKDINTAKSEQKGCQRSIKKYLKSKLGLIEKQCTPEISAPVLQKLHDLSVPALAFNTANDIVMNDTAWTAVQIFAFTHGWTITDDTRVALASALAENPDLGPLVDSGVDVLLKRDNADTVIAFLSKVKSTNDTCGPKDPIRLKSPSMIAMPSLKQ
jgi:hypothetical protein